MAGTASTPLYTRGHPAPKPPNLKIAKGATSASVGTLTDVLTSGGDLLHTRAFGIKPNARRPLPQLGGGQLIF